MKLKTTILAFAITFAALAVPVQAATFRFAFQGDLKSLDPYSLNESFTLGVLGNVYEGLTKRGKDLEIIPGLAERWEVVEPTRWRFHLRKGVKFHNGEDFTADDVVFSADRVRIRGLRPQDAHSARRHQGRQGRRPHGRLRAAAPEPDPARRVGHLVHPLEEMGGGERLGDAAAAGRAAGELRGAARQRHRPVHHRRAPGRREDGVQAQSRAGGASRSTISTR